MEKNKERLAWVVLGFLIVLSIVIWLAVYDLTKPQFLEVTFFDVSQGDSIFIETPKRQQILIDGGPSSAVLEKLAEEMPFYDKTIDLIILTHPESDHYRGLLDVLQRYEVENILWNGVVRDTAEWQEWMRLIKEEGANIIIAQAGQRIILQGSEQCGSELKKQDICIFIDILHPFENLEGQEVKRANDTSVVSQLVFSDSSFLFIGDITKKEELELAERYDLESDVLKIGHHGSKTSSDPKFIGEVSPDIAVIQCGKDNKYGHPDPEVLSILEEFDIEILRTDRDGDVKIVSDGNQLKVNYSSNF